MNNPHAIYGVTRQGNLSKANKARQAADNDYPCIRLWGKKTLSQDYYIEAQVKKARDMNAPANATYYIGLNADDKRWRTVDDIVDIHDRPDMAVFLPYLTAEAK
jgi:hypothetical protein